MRNTWLSSNTACTQRSRSSALCRSVPYGFSITIRTNASKALSGGRLSWWRPSAPMIVGTTVGGTAR